MMKTQIVLLAFLIVGLSGCTGSGGDTGGSIKAFVGGNDGLLLDFIDGAPPESVYDADSDFDIIVKVENAGESDIVPENYDNAPVLKITGIDPADFGSSAADLTQTIDLELEGAKLDPQGNAIKGSIETFNFPVSGGTLQYAGEVAGDVEFNLRASLCYEYISKAQTKLCVKEDLRGTTGKEGVCNPNNENVDIENSGSPIHISRFAQSVQGSNDIKFVFYIRHIGDGKIYQKGLSPACDASSHSNKDKVWVEIENPNLGGLRCSGLGGDGAVTSGTGLIQGYTTLYDGERSITCTIELDNPQDLEKVLEIRLKYAYEQYVSTPLVVKHST